MSDNRPEKPKILGPKPTIANKPRFIPPINLKVQAPPPTQSQQHLPAYQQQGSHATQAKRNEWPLKNEDVYQQQFQLQRPCSFNQECAKKAPNSPSTLCCSILSNTAQDCCGVMKDLNGKQLCKNESLDSNSSDSGGFKDFIQLDVSKDVPRQHQRQVSQPDVKLLIGTQAITGHQRKTSDFSYDYGKHSPSVQSVQNVQNIQNVQNLQYQQHQQHLSSMQSHHGKHQVKPYIPNAQALTPYLNQTQDKLLKIDTTDGEMMPRQINKLNLAATSQLFAEKVEVKPKQTAPLISRGEFQQSTKKLEEMLAQRIGAPLKKGPTATCLIEGETSDAEQKLLVQKQFQQKLQADLQQTVKHIQEKQSLEYRLPQNRKWNESVVETTEHLLCTCASLAPERLSLLDSEQLSLAECKEKSVKEILVEQQKPAGDRTQAHSKVKEMDDPEIQETVESILGKGVKVVDCEKKSSIKEEEVLYINGVPVELEGPDGLAIKQALITGQVPPCDLLNALLINAGILKAPVKLDTTLNVKSTTVTKEEVTVSRQGKVVDERSREIKEQNFYTTAITEVYEPIKIIPTAELLNSQYNNKFTENGYETGSDRDHRKCGSYSSASSYESQHSDRSAKSKTCLSKDSGNLSNSTIGTMTNKADYAPSSADSMSSLDETDFKCGPDAERHNRINAAANGYKKEYTPTIFGTVASDLTPKNCSNRRSLPQTPQTKIFNGDNENECGTQQENALVYRDGNLISGPLEALIQHMVPTDSYYPERTYIFAFLLSSRLFIKPHDLLDRIRVLCETQQGLGSGKPATAATARFAEHLVQLLAEWTEIFPYDFRDDRVMQHVRGITKHCIDLNVGLMAQVSALSHNLQQRRAALEAYEKALEDLAAVADENSTDISEMCPNPATLAQQLTHVELERLSFIGPEEFVQAFAKENPHLETSFKDMKKTQNLEQYVQWFNRLSYLVATQVCKYPKKKQRVKVVEYWIEVGRECFNIGNFNSLMAIIAGLNLSPISRLKKTWQKIQSGKFAILEHQMDPSSNFSSYRSTLKAAMWRSAGATDQRQRIVIPFFSLLVKDIYFLNQGCSNKLPNGHINFDKFWQLAKQVTEFMAWKEVTCPFEKDSKVIALLQNGPILNENSLALASFECEPPENNQEKERCKQLKA